MLAWPVDPFWYLMLSAMLFAVGMIGVLFRRNGIVVFMSVEMMLNAVNLSLITFARIWDNPEGAVLVFFVMCVAAAEAVVGLAIFIAIFRNRQSVDIANLNLFKG